MMTSTKAFYDFVLFEKITGLNKFQILSQNGY